MSILSGIERIARERQRQLELECWTPEHDDKHTRGELAQAAVAYTIHGTRIYGVTQNGEHYWPETWAEDYFKPSRQWFSLDRSIEDRIRNLEKAGALIAAEIDRLLREQKRKAMNTCDNHINSDYENMP